MQDERKNAGFKYLLIALLGATLIGIPVFYYMTIPRCTRVEIKDGAVIPTIAYEYWTYTTRACILVSLLGAFAGAAISIFVRWLIQRAIDLMKKRQEKTK